MAKSSRKSEIRKAHHATRRRWLHFGPGIAIAFIVSAFVLYTRIQEQTQRQSPRIERPVVSDKSSVSIVPEISSLLSRRGALKLSAHQVKEIEKLQAEWQRVSAPLREQADRAAERFKAWMDETQKRGRVAMQRVAEQRRQATEERLRIDRVAFDEGRIPKVYVLRDEAEHADANQMMTNAQRDVGIALVVLKTVMGVHPASQITLSDTLRYESMRTRCPRQWVNE
jgi:hypothetical protein